jgi:hypothetical protein
MATLTAPDPDDGPTVADLAAIEAEWPLIEAELAVTDAQIRVLLAAPGPSPLDWRRLRRAEHQVLAGQVRHAAAAGRPDHAGGVTAPAGCPVAAACQSCGARRGLAALEADTPVGVICLTLCDPCADAGRVPSLSCPAAARLALEHAAHGAAGTEAA